MLTRSRPRASRARRLAVLSVLLLGAAALPAPARAAIPQFTPVTASVLATPHTVTGTDGRLHMLYEIALENREAVPIDVLSLAVRDRAGRTLLALDRAALPSVMTVNGAGPAATLPPAAGGTVWLDVALRRGAQAPRGLVHRISAGATLPGGRTRTFTFDGARTAVAQGAAPALGPPLRGGLWLNFNGCCGLSPHRLALAPVDGTPWLSERYAADFVRIDRQGRGGAGDLTKNSSFFGFGQPVISVGPGRVMRIENDLPSIPPLNELPPGSFNTRTTLGNNVVVRLADGRYALFAHLKRGSVRVRPGQSVRTGQVLGRVGNSGDTGGPHLHFQLADRVDPVASDGLPFVFSAFALVGSVSNVEAFLTGMAPADIRAVRPGDRRRRGQLPLQATVVRFPG